LARAHGDHRCLEDIDGASARPGRAATARCYSGRSVRVLVTGGAGFIGANLVEELLAGGHEVRVLDNFSTGHRHNHSGVEDEVELIEGDLRSYERVHHAVRGCEVVFHQGALPSVPRSVQDPITTSEINVGGTLNVLLTARDEGVRRVVFASSSSIYGDAPGFPRTERQAPMPLAPYAVSKLAAEQYCRVFAKVYGLETVSLRYFNVFGKRQDPASQYSAVIPRFIMAMRDGRAPTIYGSGEQSRDFTHVDDVVAANLLAAQAPAATGGVFNIACGTHHSLNDLIVSLNRLLDTDIQPIHISPRPGDIERSWADIGLARETLGYEPEVDFEQGLRRTLAAYNEDLPVPRSAAFGS
jgi:nucleoside-diphosphate-sugar epimerase